MKPLSSNHLSCVFVILVIFLWGFLIYSNTLYYPFHFDDEPSIPYNSNIRDIHNLKAIWDFCPLRFITYLSFALNYYFHKLDVFGYHFMNILIHLTTAVSVWWLVSLTFLTPELKKEKISRYSQVISFFCALIFLVHPLQTQAVTYLVQRAACLASLFYIVSLCLYIKAQLLKEKTPVWKIYYLFSLFTALLSIFSKEIAFTLPFMLLVYEFCFLSKDKQFNLGPILSFFMLLITPVLVIHFNKLIDFQYKLAEPLPLHNYIFTQFRVLVTYLRLLFLPINQNLLYDYPISQSLWEVSTLASLGLLIFIFFIGIKLFSRYRLISFAIFWFFLTLSVESSVMPIKDVIFEHRLYLPLVGYGLFVISVFYYVFSNKRQGLFIFMLFSIIFCYSVLTYRRNFVWKDELTLWNDVVRKSSLSVKALVDSDDEIYNKVKYKRSALNQYVTKFNPRLSLAFINRAKAYFKNKEYDKAIIENRNALKIVPEYVNAYISLGLIYFNKGEYDMAISELNKFLSMKPDDVDGYNWRGNVYRAKKEYAKAISDYNQGLKIKSDFLELYLNRAITFRLLEEFDKAMSDYDYILKLAPYYFMAYNNRGYIYFLKKEYAKAISDYTRAIKIYPDYATAYHNRARAYLMTGNYRQAREDVAQIQNLGYKVSAEFLEQLDRYSE